MTSFRSRISDKSYEKNDEDQEEPDEKKEKEITNENKTSENGKWNETITIVNSISKFKNFKFKHLTNTERMVQRKNSDLLNAIENEDENMFNNAINEGASINTTCIKTGMNACHIAIIFKRCNLLIKLMNEGANYALVSWPHGYSPVHLAAYAGCLTCLKTLIEYDSQNLSVQTVNNTNKPTENDLMLDCWAHDHSILKTKIPQITPGSTPLHIACKQSHVHCVEYLLDHKPNLEIVDHQGKTALDVVNDNIIKMKREEFKGKKDIDLKLGSTYSLDSKYRSPSTVSIASSARNESERYAIMITIIYKLIQAGAVISISEESMKNCSTILHTPILLNNETLLKIILKTGVNLIVRNELGDLPLHQAIRNRAKRCLVMLLNWDENRNTIEMRDHENKTPLQIAISSGWTYGVCRMMEVAANMGVITDDGNSVLHLAASLKDHNVMAQLLSSPEAVQFVNMKNRNQETPLMVSTLHGNLMCIKKLLNYLADIHINAKNNRTLVHAAAETGHVDIIEFLLSIDEGLIHALTDNGETALHLASLQGHLNCVQLLLQKGCDIHCKTIETFSLTSTPESYDFGGTALHCAAWKGRIDIVKFLIEQNKCLVQEPNFSGWYPLHIAAYFNHVECVDYIIKNGGNLSDKVLYFDGSWKNAFDIITCSFPDSITFLRHIFDSFIFTNDLPLHHPECQVAFNFNIFTPNGNDKKQMKVLNALINSEMDDLRTQLLLHPLTDTFLHLKWKKLSKFFLVSMILQAIFTMSVTSYGILVVHYEKVKNLEAVCVSVSITLVSLVLLLLQEIPHSIKIQRYYINDLESWIKWSMFLTTFIVSIGGMYSLYNRNTDSCWKNIMAIPVLLSWIEILFLLSRFPVWGFYILMFFSVTSNVIKVFCTFASLILGFVFAFYILFKSDETEFYSIWETFVKSVAMMFEFNYSTTFKTPPDMNHLEAPVFEIVSRLIFLLFVLLSAIVLINLMIGLAVSDIVTLETRGKSQHLAKQIDFLHLLETFVYSDKIFLKLLPSEIQHRIKSYREVPTFSHFYPGKPNESHFHRFPNALKKIIMKYLQERRTKSSSNDDILKIGKKFNDGKTFTDRLLNISDELDAIKREFHQ